MSSDFHSVEKNVSFQEGSYRGLEKEALLTSEEDFLRIFKSLPDIKKWVELGSGHGLGPFLFAKTFPDRKSVGIEFERSRLEASPKTFSNAEFIHGDLLTCEIPEGDAYFFYFPTGPVLDRILSHLSKQTTPFKIIAIESHGDFLPRLQKESWLTPVQEIALSSKRHHPQAIVFAKTGDKAPSLFDHSFECHFLQIQDAYGTWLGESFGLEWQHEDEFVLKSPPRSFKSSDVQRILTEEEIPKEFHPALQLRKLGMLKISTNSRIHEGHIRKIYVSPSFKVEISSGEQVEWGDVKQIFWETHLCFDSSSDYFFYPHVV